VEGEGICEISPLIEDEIFEKMKGQTIKLPYFKI